MDLCSQTNEVYAWEHEFCDWNENHCSRQECQQIVDTACAHYDVKPPRVKLWKRDYCWCPDTLKKSKYLLDKPIIWLNPGGQNWASACHEAAHWIQMHVSPRAQSHGATWLGIYMWLLIAAGVAPEAAIKASARVHKLRWVPRSPNWFKCKQTVSRAAVRRARKRKRNG